MELVRYETAKRALAEARSVDEVKDIRDRAEAVRIYAKQAGDYEMQNWAAEIRLRAERRAGNLIAEMKKAKGSRNQLRGRDASGPRLERAPEDTVPTLADLGISHDQSSKWQMLARIPQSKFDTLIERAKERNEELTTGAVLDELAEDDDIELNVRLRGLASSAIDNRPAKRGPYKPRRGANVQALIAFEDVLERLREARKFDAAIITNGASIAVARAWHKELPRHIEFLKDVLDGSSI
jgi:hypothetical protein